MATDRRDIDRLIDDAFEQDRTRMPEQQGIPDAGLLRQLASTATPDAPGTPGAGSMLGSGSAFTAMVKILASFVALVTAGYVVYYLTSSSPSPVSPTLPAPAIVPVDSPAVPIATDTLAAGHKPRNVVNVQTTAKPQADTTRSATISAEDDLIMPPTKKTYRSDSANIPLHPGRRRQPKANP
jgi:hypothetical protein